MSTIRLPWNCCWNILFCKTKKFQVTLNSDWEASLNVSTTSASNFRQPENWLPRQNKLSYDLGKSYLWTIEHAHFSILSTRVWTKWRHHWRDQQRLSAKFIRNYYFRAEANKETKKQTNEQTEQRPTKAQCRVHPKLIFQNKSHLASALKHIHIVVCWWANSVATALCKPRNIWSKLKNIVRLFLKLKIV